MAIVQKQQSWFLYRRREEKESSENVRIPELCRQKLLNYAESFEELARSLEDPKEEEREVFPETDRYNFLEERKVRENRLLISNNLCEVARIMTRLAGELFCFRPMEERYRRMLVHALRAESIYAENFCYLTENADETHAISMTLYTDKKTGRPAQQIADMLSVLLNRPLQVSAASPYLVEQEPHSFVFMEEAKYVALTGFCKVTKENEIMSGDHYSILESEKGKMTLLLSDGTGSGEQASKDSERVLDLMEKLLEAGYEMESAVHMVNVAFFAKGEEYAHPTLDICDINLYDGSCSFWKVGGSASFLKRGNAVEQIRQGNLPLGIFRNVELSRSDKQLQDGDYLILMTDGVLDALSANNYEEAMEQMIAGLEEVSPTEIAESLLQMALRSCGGHIQDDMTVLVAGIWENASV